MSIINRNNIARRLRKSVYSIQGKSGDVTLSANDVEAQMYRKDNTTATTVPGPDDDETKGYSALSKWMNTTNGDLYTCVYAAAGQAIWKSDDLTIEDLGSASMKNIGTTDTDVPTVSTVKQLLPPQQTKNSLGLDKVNNTSDTDKPVSDAQALAIQDVIDLVQASIEHEIETAFTKIDYSIIKNTPALFSGSYNDLANKPVLFDGSYQSLSNKPALFDGKFSSLKEVPNLFDGKWASLTDRPILFDGKYSSLSGLPNLFDGTYDSLTGKPVAFSQSYNDLKDKPNLFDGKYTSLTNTPTLFSGKYADLTDKPNLFDGNYNNLSNLPTLFSGSWLNLTDKPTLFSGSYSDLANKPTLFDGRYASLTGLPSLFDGTWSSLSGKPILFSGSYADLSNKPFIPSTTSDISEGTNLYYTNARVQSYLDTKGIKGVKYFDAVTDSNSVWTIDASVYFSSVDFVSPVALSTMAGTLPLITEQRTAHLVSMSTISAIKGTVTKSNNITTVLISSGAPGITFHGAGAQVKIKVEGTLK